MSNKMWGGRFGSGPDPIMEDINASIHFDRHLYRQDIAASKAHAAMLAKQGIIAAQDAKRIAHGLDTILSEIEAGKFSFKRALEDIHMNVESRLIGPDRAGGRAAPYRALAQRSGRDRFPALGARRDRRDRFGARRLSAGACRKGAQARRYGDAGLHPFAAGAAGDFWAPSPRLCRDGGPRPRPLRRCAGAAQRKPARRGRACRHLVSDRSRHDRKGARLCAADGEFARRGCRPRFRAGDLVGLRHCGRASVALCRRDRDLVVAAHRPRQAVGQVHHRLLDDAAEAQSGRGRTGARQDRPHRRRVDRPHGGDQGPAARLPEGFAGGQRGRDRRHRARSLCRCGP